MQPRNGGRATPAPHSQVLRRQPRHLRSSACISRSTRGRRDVQQAPDRPPEMRPEQFICAAWLSNTTRPCWTIIDSDPESSATALLASFTQPNKAWVTDITYVRTWQGWLYLAVVMDLFSRRIVGWATSATIHREVVLDAVLMAVRKRRPASHHHPLRPRRPNTAVTRGDASVAQIHQLVPSMSRKGNCWDNAYAESFFSSLKKERIKKHIYPSRELALADIATYIRELLQSHSAPQPSRRSQP